MFEKLMWAAAGGVVIYLALKQRARIETLVRDAIDRDDAKPATTASTADEPDMPVGIAVGEPSGCSGCGCGGTCGGTTSTIPGSSPDPVVKTPAIESPPIIPPWIPIDLSFSF